MRRRAGAPLAQAWRAYPARTARAAASGCGAGAGRIRAARRKPRAARPHRVGAILPAVPSLARRAAVRPSVAPGLGAAASRAHSFGLLKVADQRAEKTHSFAAGDHAMIEGQRQWN